MCPSSFYSEEAEAKRGQCPAQGHRRFGGKLMCISLSISQNTVHFTLIGHSYHPSCSNCMNEGARLSKFELTQIPSLLKAELGLEPRSWGTNS